MRREQVGPAQNLLFGLHICVVVKSLCLVFCCLHVSLIHLRTPHLFPLCNKIIQTYFSFIFAHNIVHTSLKSIMGELKARLTGDKEPLFTADM